MIQIQCDLQGQPEYYLADSIKKFGILKIWSEEIKMPLWYDNPWFYGKRMEKSFLCL